MLRAATLVIVLDDQVHELISVILKQFEFVVCFVRDVAFPLTLFNATFTVERLDDQLNVLPYALVLGHFTELTLQLFSLRAELLVVAINNQIKCLLSQRLSGHIKAAEMIIAQHMLIEATEPGSVKLVESLIFSFKLHFVFVYSACEMVLDLKSRVNQVSIFIIDAADS